MVDLIRKARFICVRDYYCVFQDTTGEIHNMRFHEVHPPLKEDILSGKPMSDPDNFEIVLKYQSHGNWALWYASY